MIDFLEVEHSVKILKKQVDTGDVLVAIFAEPDSHAVYFLGTEGIGRLEVLEYISHSLPESYQNEPQAKPDQAPVKKKEKTI